MAESVNEPGNLGEPMPVEAELTRIEAVMRRDAGRIMRTQARRAWLVPLLAVPMAELVTAPEVPPDFLPYNDDERATVTTAAARVRAVMERLGGSDDARLSDDDALALVVMAADHREVAAFAFSFQLAVTEWLGLPDGLSGAGLVRRLAEAIRDRPDPPAVLALVGSTLLEDDLETGGRGLLPLPDDFYSPVTRALDQRCFELGLRTWEDGVRYAVATWTAERWRGLLMAMAFGAANQMGQLLAGEVIAFEAARDEPPPVLPPPGPRGKRRRKPEEAAAESPDPTAIENELAATQANLAAARQREAELVSARDRAQARVTALDERVASLERELQSERGMKRALEADLRRLRGEPEPAPAPDVVSAPLPEDLLRGRQVFLFTGQVRTGAREEMAESLREIGADDLRVFHVDEGAPGPEVFPPGAVVVVDTRFAGHKHTADLKARVRRSPGAEYLQVQGGEGGLASRVAERLRRKS